MTGLPDRRAIAEQAAAWRSASPAVPFAVLFLDLVNFKRVNDEQTHAGGDAVLARIARRLAESVRDGDLVARYGGDEFVILLKNVATPEAAAPIVERLRTCGWQPTPLMDLPINVGITIGVAVSGEDAAPIEELIAEADRAMYARKRRSASTARAAGRRPARPEPAAPPLFEGSSLDDAVRQALAAAAASGPPLVELADVDMEYDNGVVALEGFNLRIGDGELVSLLGPSGCGKSTVLRIVAGLSRPTRGVVRRDWDGSPAVAGADPPLGCVFQEPTLLPWANVWNNVYLPLRLRGESRAAVERRVEEALDLTRLSGFSGAYPRELSGGMKMRAAVARALVAEPRLLLLDEPFAALDELTRNRLNDDLLWLRRRQGWAGLFITHSVLEAVYLSTRVLVMSPRPGRVVAELAIDLPAKRTSETRSSDRYIELCRQASAALAAASGEAAEAAHG